MTSKEFFRRVWEAQKEISIINMRREKYLSIAVGMGGMSETGIHATGNKSKVELAALSLVELSDRLGNTAAEYAKLVSDAEGLISRLERQRHRQVLTLRYIEGRPWKAISDIMGYQDEKSVFRVHGWALKAAQQLLDGGKD